MNNLFALQNIGFKITWKLVYIGMNGYDEIQAILTRDEVKEYIITRLEDKNVELDRIVRLICEYNNSLEFDKIIKNLSDIENSIYVVEKRKWRAFLLKSLLDNKKNDSIQGMIDLLDFWTSMGLPEGNPMPIPESNDKEILQEYFGDLSYLNVIERNQQWLQKEIQEILDLDL